MKKYTTPLLTQYNVVTEGLMALSGIKAPDSSFTMDGGEADTFEKQFPIWGDDLATGESDDMDFNSTGIF